MILNLNVHFTRVSDLIGRDELIFDPPLPMTGYRDSFGNWCTRVVAPRGRTRLSTDALVKDTGAPEVIAPQAQQLPVPDLPEETLLFLLGSRYCETDRLSEIAWKLFGSAKKNGRAIRPALLRSGCRATRRDAARPGIYSAERMFDACGPFGPAVTSKVTC
jgi:hypothetical protein